jgi:ERCC4-type nuclease
MYSLLIDHRERAIFPFLDMEVKGFIYDQRQLNTGDFLIIKKNKKNDNFCIMACIERKTYNDFASSFRDGRYKSELNKMLQLRRETGCKLFFIIEGTAFPSQGRIFSRIPYSCILGAINKLMIVNNIFIIQTENEKHTAAKLNELLNTYTIHVAVCGGMTDETNTKNDEIDTKTGETNTKTDEIDTKTGEIDTKTDKTNTKTDTKTNTKTDEIDTKTDEIDIATNTIFKLESSLKTITKRIPKTNEEILLGAWSSLKGVSIVLGKILMNKFSIYDLVTEIVTIEDLKNLKTAFGKKINKDAIDSLLSVRCGNKKNSIRILSSVVGMSSDYATKLIDVITLKEICQIIKDDEYLALIELIVCNKKIGKKKAENIYKLLKSKS